MHDPTVLQPPRGSGGASVVLLSVCALAGVAGIAVAFGMLDLVKQAEMGAAVTEERWFGALRTFVMHSLWSSALYLLTGIFFLTWLYKSVAFARFVAPKANRMSPAWAWTLIVPALGQIVPVQIAHAAYTSCHRADQERSGRRTGGSGGTVVMAWGSLWALMWVSNLLLNLGFIGQRNPFVEGATADTVLTFWYAYLGLQAITALAAAAGAVMVMKLTGLQGRLAGAGLDGALDDEPALSRGGLPGMPVSGVEAEPAPPLIPATAADEDGPQTDEQPLSAPAPVSGLPGMPPPPPAAATDEEEVVRRAGLPPTPPAPAEEEPRQFMPGIPPPPGQSEAA